MSTSLVLTVLVALAVVLILVLIVRTLKKLSRAARVFVAGALSGGLSLITDVAPKPAMAVTATLPDVIATGGLALLVKPRGKAGGERVVG